MRKSIKKIAASLLAATMVLGSCVSAFAYETGEKIVKNDKGEVTETYDAVLDCDDGENVFLFVGNMSQQAWKQDGAKNVMTDAGVKGVVKYTATFPAYSEDSKYASRFAIVNGAYYDDDNQTFTLGAWARILLGEPTVTAKELAAGGYTCFTNIRVACEAETEVTVYFDTRTYTVYMEDAEGKPVDYLVSWMGNDDDGLYLSVDEMSKLSREAYMSKLLEAIDAKTGKPVNADREKDLASLLAGDEAKKQEPAKLANTVFGETYAKNLEGLATYVNGGADYVAVPEEPTTEETTTAKKEEATTTAAAKEEATTTTAAAATTAAKQAPKTGDVAPVALMVVLFATVAVVAVAAKKKEA